MNAKYCVGLLIALHLSLSEAAAQPTKIVIDCDPGIDDAMAIVLAMQYSGFEIVGISTMFGNAYVDQATRNALTVVELSGRTIRPHSKCRLERAAEDARGQVDARN